MEHAYLGFTCNVRHFNGTRKSEHLLPLPVHSSFDARMCHILPLGRKDSLYFQHEL